MWSLYFGLLFAGFAQSTEGAFYFTKEPEKKVYFLKGSNASFEWDYFVEDRAAEFRFIIWKAQNTSTMVFIPLMNENENFDFAISGKIPPAYVGRVEKKGRATLVIKSVSFEDSTRYRCLLQAKDTRFNQSDVQLVVTGPSTLRDKYPRAELGGSAKFTCYAINVPSQNFTWMIIKEEHTQKIINDARHSITSPGSGSSELTIRNISTIDGGYYICNATVNEPNVVYGYLQILQDMSYKPCPNLSYNVRTGRNDLALCCPVSGYPKPVVTWEKNGTQLQKSENPLYFISKVEEEDFGNYTCTATDGKSFITSAVSVGDKIAKLHVEATDGTVDKAANLKWTQQSGADYYVVKINGNDINPNILIGKQTDLEVHYHTLVMKNEKEDKPETTVCVEVSALDLTGVIAKTKDPPCKTLIIRKPSDTVN